ncbi:MAG: NADP-dependent isocitrate dehydrogenase [Burkholderiaceae bacterium]|nr:NADP-dependent isocitrate dehydrogenase [Burkholderiaceae bacterium]MCD8517214.1 NADP-dependent isocitrate dehydrogenase [Burkholderiaceae bacterium]MCD8565239.1 NADP-dependent isocitrate dehydrogenase [Burkholderiaceae bacterium]
MKELTPITVACGDGIGPEIMAATLAVLDAAGARIKPEFIEIGQSQYLAGHSSGISPDAWDSLRRTKVFLKAPITTPQGGGFKSLNVTIRKTLGLYANIRPCVSYAPFVPTLHPDMNIVIVRENEEDLYAGIEHRQTDDVYQCLKLITRPGCERIVRYAFEYAQSHGRKHVTCMTKDNIMKMTDGLFHKVFDEMAHEYPAISTDHMIIDIGAARLATRPNRFDVIVTPNLYGDIISDIAAELTGSVGLAPSANIGDQCAMFEAIHGSAPDIAGQGIANPSGLLLAAVLMLVHIGQPAVAESIHNAWLCAIEQGVHSAELHQQTSHLAAVGTQAFAQAVIDRLGHVPSHFMPVTYTSNEREETNDSHTSTIDKGNERKTVAAKTVKADKQMVGVDVFVHAPNVTADFLAGQLSALTTNAFALQMITNRGVKVWPGGFGETFCTDHWRCRFAAPNNQLINHADIIGLLQALTTRGIDVIKTENLCTFNGERGFALGQGQ